MAKPDTSKQQTDVDGVTRLDTPRARQRVAPSRPQTVILSNSPVAPNTNDSRITAPPLAWLDALHGEEVARAHSWSGLVVLLCLVTLAATPFLLEELWARLCFGGALAILGATAVWVRVRSRDEASYDQKVFRIFGYTAASVSIVLEYFLGIFSPTPLVVTLGITFFGLGRDHTHALGICLLAVSGYLVLAALTTAGAIPDSTVIPAANASFSAKLYFTIIGPMVMLVSLWMAQVSRKSMFTAIERSTSAIRLARQREAQLLEAKQQLEQALHAGKGFRGRYSGIRAGRYELNDLIGRGGMGEVYAATDTQDGGRAAVKVLNPDILDVASNFERFVREGKVTQRLRSPHVVAVHGVGMLEGDLPYIAMELLEGVELASRLRSDDRLSLHEICELANHVARGLDAAHAAGVIHRDLKPQNIFYVRHSKVWKILDFGVSKFTHDQKSLTGHGKIVGTPGYMAPEQARGEDVDHRTDVFAFGSLLYRCITGAQPFVGADIPTVLYRIVYKKPVAPSALVDALPEQIDAVLSVAMAKQPAHRFQTAGALAKALELAIAGELPLDTLQRAKGLVTSTAK